MAIVRLQLPENASPQKRVFDDKQWVQPLALDSQFPDPLSNKYWSFDFSLFERRLWLSKYVGLESWSTDSDALELINIAAAEIGKDLTEDKIGRFRFLLSKGTSPKFANEFSDLLKKYVSYQKDYLRDYQSNLENLRFAKEEERFLLLKQMQSTKQQLQAKHFGSELAKKLFYRKNLTANYFNQRGLIQMDRSLDLEAKVYQLELLKKRYSAQLKTIRIKQDIRLKQD
jgi:hypothetical protein